MSTYLKLNIDINTALITKARQITKPANDKLLIATARYNYFTD